MLIEVDTPDKRLAPDLFGNPKSLSVGASSPLPFGGLIQLKEWRFRKALGAGETLELLLSFSSGVASSLVANWLWEKFHSRATTLRINRVEVHLQQGEVQRIVAEQLKVEQK